MTRTHEAPPHRSHGRGLADHMGVDMDSEARTTAEGTVRVLAPHGTVALITEGDGPLDYLHFATNDGDAQMDVELGGGTAYPVEVWHNGSDNEPWPTVVVPAHLSVAARLAAQVHDLRSDVHHLRAALHAFAALLRGGVEVASLLLDKDYTCMPSEGTVERVRERTGLHREPPDRIVYPLVSHPQMAATWVGAGA